MPSSDSFFKKFPGDVWIETGTYLGDGIRQALDAGYKKVVSIELSEQLALDAKARFSNHKNVEIVNSRAHEVLFEILCKLPKKEKVVFWLDAHYSACGTAGIDDPQPLLKELLAIEKWKKSDTKIQAPVVLIDDMRTFSYEDCGFSEKEILDHLKKIDENYKILKSDGFQEQTQRTFKEDILVAVPENYVIIT